MNDECKEEACKVKCGKDRKHVYTFEAEDREDMSFIWDNYFDEETGRNEYDLTLFIGREDGLFERRIEVHEEQGYTLEEVKGFLLAGGMEFVRVFDADTGEEPTDTSEKVFFIAREKGKQRTGK